MRPALSARGNGKTAAMLEDIRERLARREHVHVARNPGTYCLNGPAGCTAERRTLTQLERELRSRAGPSPRC